MQRLEWHCHTKSVSGALYRAILYHGHAVCRKRDGGNKFTDFPENQWNIVILDCIFCLPDCTKSIGWTVYGNCIYL